MIRLLLADDSATNRAAIATVLADDAEVDIVGEAENGEEAVEIALELEPDAILMDVEMPVLDGTEATRQIRAALPEVRIIALTAHDEVEVIVAMIDAGANAYCLKGAPLADVRRALDPASGQGWVDQRVAGRVFEAVVQLYQQERRVAGELAEAIREIGNQSTKVVQLTLGVVRSLAAAVEARDEYTGGHIERVSRYALLLTERAAPELLADPRVEFGYILHDVGKIAVPDAVLRKSGPLTEEEWVLMRSHVDIGAHMLGAIPEFEPVREIVRYHHERWDGAGYQQGVAAEEIPLPARLFAVCDAFDAMTTERPYQAARTPEAALSVLEGGSGTQWDPGAVHEFAFLVECGSLGEERALGLSALAAVPRVVLRG